MSCWRRRSDRVCGRPRLNMKLLSLLVGAAALFSQGCGYVQPYAQSASRDRWAEPQSQWVVHKGDIEINFKVKPRAPDETQEAELEISIVDLSVAPPKPVADARVNGTARMPRKPGHIHVLELRALHKEIAPGDYGMHLTFGMGGQWLAEFQIVLPDGRVFKEDFPLVISGSEQAPWERKGKR